jgi:hypothetical protein
MPQTLFSFLKYMAELVPELSEKRNAVQCPCNELEVTPRKQA